MGLIVYPICFTTSHRCYRLVAQQNAGTSEQSKLKSLVPSVGVFFTPLPLERAFLVQDERRRMSFRHFVPPSFNDVRLILNTAQVLSHFKTDPLQLITFDGDLTLYDDGESLKPDSPVIPRIFRLLERNICVGIVTAAGYTEAEKYYSRLYGLLDAVCIGNEGSSLSVKQKRNLVVLGGECNFLLQLEPDMHAKNGGQGLQFVPRDQWALDAMKQWTEEDIQKLLDLAESVLRGCIENMKLPAELVRKPRAVGIVPNAGVKLAREQLEETVLAAQRKLDLSDVGKRLPFCAFNGELVVNSCLQEILWPVQLEPPRNKQYLLRSLHDDVSSATKSDCLNRRT